MSQINTGYKPSVHLPEHEVFNPEKLGSIPPNASGNWLPYIPPQDVQQNIGIEAEDCTSNGTLDAIETLAKFLYNDSTVWSPRYLAWVSGTTPDGNDPWTVGTALENKGTVPEMDWPQTANLTTWAELYVTPPQDIQTKALEWPAQYSLSKKWVNTDIASLKASLEFAPLPVAGFSWAQDENGLYYTPEGAEPCHYFCLLSVNDVAGAVNGVTFTIFDSYENDIKTLRGDYQFSDAIQYTLTNNVVVPSAWAQFIASMKSWLGF